MNQEFELSVVVLTYHPDYEKLFRTLYSIVNQKNIKLEIIVSDDGSLDFDCRRVEQWFQYQEFEDYTILTHDKNQGTVKNAVSAVEKAKGNIVKLISPGDYLYNDFVLENMYHFMKKHDSKICFGKAVYYSEAESDNGYTLHKNFNPRYIRPYIKKNDKKIRINYLIYKDYILGAVFVFDKEILSKYLYKIEDKVVYAEDSAVICMVADGITIDYWKDYMLWYEYGTGISTNQSEKWNQRLLKDNESCFRIIKSEHPEWEKAYQLTFDDRYKSRFGKKVRFFLHNKMTKVYRMLYDDRQVCETEYLEKLLSYKTE